MAITEQDLNISNISYTNKDFGAIYTELLDIARKLSFKIDPASSNESDPFIILLKLMAFVGDKLNYNVDKNILEQFTTSLTQRQSMHELAARLGCPMHYFQSAKIKDVFFKVTKDITADITIPAFSELQDSSGTIKFITLGDTSILSSTKSSSSVAAIQGDLKSLSVLGSNTITLRNLDEKLRLYLPEYYVAENGIFIQYAGSPWEATEWTLVSSINGAVIYGTRVYEVGFDDNRDLPYIQFPTWISDIIGGGLNIHYLVTKGKEGNVAANSIASLTKLGPGGSIEGTALADLRDITVKNTAAALSGKDPDTIEEAYNNLKYQQGTFETLVTCRDFANFLYNSFNEGESNYLVSNAQVGDRRTDINYGCTVASYGEYGPLNISKPGTSITASELCLYPLQPGNFMDSKIKLLTKYNDTFKGINDKSIAQNAIENSGKKLISRDYKTFAPNDIYAIKNYYKLNGVIFTTEKVDAKAQINILENVKEALARDYNARKVEYGYEIPYDRLVQTIEEADARIKSVELYEPDLEPKAYLVDQDTLGSISFNPVESPTHNPISGESNNWFNIVVYKNILAGTVSVFQYDTDFEYDFNQKQINENTPCRPDITKNKPTLRVSEFTSETNIESIAVNSSYELKQNEAIQFISDSYQVSQASGGIYAYGINYNLQLDTGDYIPENTQYTLSGSSKLTFFYEKDGVIKTDVYEAGDKVLTKNKLYTTAYRIGQGETARTAYDGIETFMLQTNDEVKILEAAKASFKTAVNMYWHLNSDDNTLTFKKAPTVDNASNIYEYIVQSGEEILITDPNFSDLNAFGEGSKLLMHIDSTEEIISWESPKGKVEDLAAVYEEGLESMRDYFAYKQFSEDSTWLEVREQEILTLSEGDTLSIEVSTGGSSVELVIPDNNFNTVSTSGGPAFIPSDIIIKYTPKGETSPITLEAKPDWRVRALLDISAGPSLWQTLVGNQEVNFKFKYWASDHSKWESYKVPGESEDYTITIQADTNAKNSFKFNSLVQKEGGEGVSLEFLNLLTDLDTTNFKDYPKIYCADITSAEMGASSIIPNAYDPNYRTFTLKNPENSTNTDVSVEFSVPTISSYLDLFMVYYGADDNKLKITNVVDLSGTLSSDGIVTQGLHVFKVDNTAAKVTFTNTAATSPLSFTISKLRVAKDKTCNPDLALMMEYPSTIDETTTTEVKSPTPEDCISCIKGVFSGQAALCNFLNFTESAKVIEMSHPMDHGQTFFDVNNIANKWVIPQLDFNQSNIVIASRCKK